jgi:hypothetical protein
VSKRELQNNRSNRRRVSREIVENSDLPPHRMENNPRD